MAKFPKQKILDEHLFRQQMKGVVPLKTAATTNSRAPRITGGKLRSMQQSLADARCFPVPSGNHDAIDTDDGSTHRKNGVQKKVIQKLKRGQYPLADQLDLHNMSLATGQSIMVDFIESSRRESVQCVRIIHGKGLRSGNGPRLKNMAWQILRDHPQVLAFTTCKPVNGGSGAVDVLLRST